MERIPRAALLTELMTRLHAQGSWCGETHVQKAVYLLQELFGLPTGFHYILYMHGPYSFDLSEELTSLRADFLIDFNHRSPGYGPALVPTQTSAELRARFPKTLARYREPVEFIAKAFNSRGVADLEKLATALYVTRELQGTTDVIARAARLSELKPHVSSTDALAAIQELDRITAEAKSLMTDATPA